MTMKKNEKHTLSEKTIIITVFIVFTLHSITLFIPFIWGFLSSLKANAIEYFDNLYGLPRQWRFENYIKAFEMLSVNDIGFFEMLFNSLWFSGGSAVIAVLTCAVCSYTFARYDFPCKKFLEALSILIMTIPIYGTLPAQYSMYTRIGLKNSPLILLTAFGCFGTSQFLVMTSYYKNLSKDYKDAATVDGANDFTAFFLIMLPQSIGLIITYTVTQFITSWNDYYSPLLYLDKLPTLASGLFTYQTIVERTGNYPLFLAAVLISAVPTIILYSSIHNVMVKNLSIGGLKG